MGSIPNIGAFNGDGMDDAKKVEALIDHVAKLQKMVQFMMTGNISSVNAREFGGWRVGLTELQSRAGDVGMSTANDAEDPVRLWAGSTDKNTAPWRVYQSGKSIMTGARIRSRDGGYPYVEMDPETDLFAAYGSADNFIKIVASGVYGFPAIDFRLGSKGAAIYMNESLIAFDTSNVPTLIGPSTEAMNLVGVPVMINGIDVLAVLDGKATKSVSTGTSPTFNCGIPIGATWETSEGVVAWSGVPSHAHSQN